MEAKHSQFVLKLLPSFTDFAFLMPLLFLFGRMDGVMSLLSDGDTGWHIRTGEWIAANRAVPMVDLFSFSRPGEPWFAWEWLADLLFAELNAIGGLRAVTFFSSVLLAVTFTLLFRLVRRKSNAIVAICCTMLAAAISSIHWLARPHLFTLLFLVLFYGALERVRDGQTHWAGIPYLAILPVLTILWTNLHGGFIAGIIVIGAYACGEVLQIVFAGTGQESAGSWERARAYLLCTLACLAASLINPYTYHLHVHIAQYLRDPWTAQHILEFFSLSFRHPIAVFYEVLLALAVASALMDLSRHRFVNPLLIAIWAHGALLSVRNIPIFAILAAPAVAATIQDWLAAAPSANVAGWVRRAIAAVNRKAAETSKTEAVGRWHLVSLAGLALVSALLWARNPPKKFRAEFDPGRYPAAALAYLSDPAARIFTHDEWGDYLIWRLYPTHRVFVDGRSDFYGDTFENNCIDVLNVKHGWEAILGRYGVDTILMPPDAPLTGALKESRKWSVVYDDGVAVIFRAVTRTVGATVSAAAGVGRGRDREVTKIEASDRPITDKKSKT